MSKHRRQRQQARDLERRDTSERDLVVVAAAISGLDRSHPELLMEHVPSDHPFVTEPIHPHVLTHDASGDSDEH